jgi:alkylation response protein AidB-like acyl-CoA dehydrogenase
VTVRDTGVDDLLQAVERLRPLIAENAAAAEANRQLPQAVYDAMHDAGLFGMLAPKAYGGLELHPVGCMRVWEAVARIDSAAAWNLMMNQGAAAFAAFLPAEGSRELFGDGPTTVAGAFFPPGTALRAEGRWRVTGQVPFASGCHNARWLAMSVIEIVDGVPKLDPATGGSVAFGAVFPRSAAVILDTWHTVGMRATGSADISVKDLLVPDRLTARVAPLAHPAPGFEGPLFRMWPWTLILGETTLSVGIAAAALEAAIELCQSKTAAYNATPLREQQLPQFQIGKARALLEASRDTLHRAGEAAYDEVTGSGGLLSPEVKTRLQLAVAFAAEATAEAVRFVNTVAGTSSIRMGQPFERHFRDVHTLLQHTSKNSARYGSAGRMILGLEPDPNLFWLNL